MLHAFQLIWHLIFTTTCLSVVPGCTSKQLETPEVDLPLGKVYGKFVSFHGIQVKSFQGIPFAQPPIGDLRFKKPRPVKPWEVPLQADTLPPGCIQYSPSPFPPYDDMPGQSLDCLYLNLWIPPNTTTTNKKPVMFWMHGGGFRIGSSRMDYFDGTILALADVVVVTFNYRLGVEGFLYSGTEEAPGNMGLYDVLEALKWTNSYIEHFGGDKDSITFFSQSAGSIATGMLMVSPLAKGLFTKAILQSGSAANLDADNNDKDFVLSKRIANAVNCTDGSETLDNNPVKVFECLKDKDALELAKIVYKVKNDSQRGLYPRYGDEILPTNAREAIIQGQFNGMNILIGNNKDEGAIMVTQNNEDVFGFFGHKKDSVNKTYGEYLIRKSFKSFQNAYAVVEHYLGSLEENDGKTILDQVKTASGDVARVCPSVFLAESVAKKGYNVYYYQFTHRPSESPYAPWMGTVHFDETPFVFGYPIRYPNHYTELERELSRRMIGIWRDFAKYGTLDSWPLYSENQHYYRTLDTNGENVEVGPHLQNCNFFRPYFGLHL